MQKPNIFYMSAPQKKKKRKEFCLCFSLHLEDKKAVQYHINWVDENGHSHNLSNTDKNHLENEE